MNKGIKIKSNKGITLVALIITIVVLLILAGVAISTARDSDIIGHAQNAAGGYNAARQNEIDQIAGYEELLKNYGNSNSGNFDWSSVNLTNVDCDAYYVFSDDDGTIYTATFSTSGKINITVENAAAGIKDTKEIIAKDNQDSTTKNVKFEHNLVGSELILTMNGEDINVYVVKDDDNITLLKSKMMEVLVEEGVQEGTTPEVYCIFTEKNVWIVNNGELLEQPMVSFQGELTTETGTLADIAESLNKDSLTVARKWFWLC